jgi:hypothetical protein
MSRRSWLYGLLVNDPQLRAIHRGEVFQASALTTANKAKPYLVYHIGNNTSEMLTDDHPASRIFFQVYIHDEPGDYDRIDALGDRVKALLTGQGYPSAFIYTTRFLERSQDLSDETLRTIFQYLRFQWVLSK